MASSPRSANALKIRTSNFCKFRVSTWPMGATKQVADPRNQSFTFKRTHYWLTDLMHFCACLWLVSAKGKMYNISWKYHCRLVWAFAISKYIMWTLCCCCCCRWSSQSSDKEGIIQSLRTSPNRGMQAFLLLLPLWGDLDTLMPWCLDALMPWYLDTLMPWYFDTLIPWYLDTLIPWYLDTLIPWYLDTLIPWYLDTLIPR